MTLVSLISYATIIILPTGGIIDGHKCGDIGGLYNQETKTVYVCGEYTDNNFILYHELGHFFYFNYLDKKTQDLYTVQYSNATEFYREYSKQSPVEDFADNFSNMILQKRQPRQVQLRMSWIKKVFKNR